MLAEKQIIKDNLTIFEFPVQDEKGNWKIRVTRNGIVVKMTYALNEEQAKEIRGTWINVFWGNSLG